MALVAMPDEIPNETTQGNNIMNTYAIINRPQEETETVSFFEPCRIEGIPTNLTFREANALCAQARANGHDVIVYNTQAQ